MTRLAAENPHPTYDTADGHIEIARHGLVAAASMYGVPPLVADAIVAQLIVEFQKAVAPHIEASGYRLQGVERG